MGTIKQAKVNLPSLQAMMYQCLLANAVFILVSMNVDGHVNWQPELLFFCRMDELGGFGWRTPATDVHGQARKFRQSKCFCSTPSLW
ncbi:hypothetical protein QW180_05735 [Vibrio sinaloensis]|nr:hypothetical protein [Vibrio sinaloensis]